MKLTLSPRATEPCRLAVHVMCNAKYHCGEKERQGISVQKHTIRRSESNDEPASASDIRVNSCFISC